MFEQAFDNLRLATESSIHMQQELFKKWVSVWPGLAPAANAGNDKIQKAQKKWAEFVADLVKKERETLETQFSAGLKNIEDAFRLAEAKEPEELRARPSSCGRSPSTACGRRMRPRCATSRRPW